MSLSKLATLFSRNTHLRPRIRAQCYWFFGRPTLEDLRQDLRAVLKKCQPDWDITTPELKAAWH
jgi:hypothetical protein